MIEKNQGGGVSGEALFLLPIRALTAAGRELKRVM